MTNPSNSSTNKTSKISPDRIEVILIAIGLIVTMVSPVLGQNLVFFIAITATFLVACFLGISRLVGFAKYHPKSTITLMFSLVVIAFLGGFALQALFNGTISLDSSVLSLDNVAFNVDTFEGADEQSTAGSKAGGGYLRNSYDSSSGKQIVTYEYKYNIPADCKGGYCFAGFKLTLEQAIDMKNYKSIKMKVRFANKDTRFKLLLATLRDEPDNQKWVWLGNNEIIDAALPGVHTVEINISERFHPLETKPIKEITFKAETDLSKGESYFAISEIQFVRK